MTRGVAALALTLLIGDAGCGGETRTVTVTGPTVTETSTMTETVLGDEGIEAMAETLCREYGPLARTFGGLSSDAEIADELAEDVPPDLRAAARRGCLAGLKS